MKRTILVMVVLLWAGSAYGAERNLRFVKMFQIPGFTERLVIAEGEFEPRSIGSYALRIYKGTSQKFAADEFVVGLIRPRNGTVEAVKFSDMDGHGRPEVVVIMRSAGSGGYLSADAFRYRTGSLEIIGSVSGLDKRADPIAVLRDQFKAPAAAQ